MTAFPLPVLFIGELTTNSQMLKTQNAALLFRSDTKFIILPYITSTVSLGFPIAPGMGSFNDKSAPNQLALLVRQFVTFEQKHMLKDHTSFIYPPYNVKMMC